MKTLLVIGGTTPAMTDRLTERFTVQRQSEQADPDAWLVANGSDVDYVLTNGHDGVKPAHLSAMPNVQVISCYGVGYDAIDTAAARAQKAIVTHTPNVLNAEVATTALMLAMACYRNLLADEAHARSGKWATEGNAPLSRSLDKQTIGILGLGRIGQAIADKFAPFNPTVLYHSRSPKDVPYTYFADLAAMAEASDVLICITPGGPETAGMVNSAVLNALGPDSTLINVSRGSVVDEPALVSALQDGRLGWAGLDVFAQEPVIPDALKSMSNVVLLPHVGSATVETRAAMGNLAVDNLIQHLDGQGVVSAVPECADM